MTSASIVSLSSMLQLLWTSTVTALAVCVCFALALRALTSASVARESGRFGAAFAHTVSAAIPLLICAGAIAAGAVVLTGG